MAEYTKRTDTIHYTEVVYFKDGEEIARERNYDDSAYDWTDEEPMTEDDIFDYGDEDD